MPWGPDLFPWIHVSCSHSLRVSGIPQAYIKCLQAAWALPVYKISSIGRYSKMKRKEYRQPNTITSLRLGEFRHPTDEVLRLSEEYLWDSLPWYVL